MQREAEWRNNGKLAIQGKGLAGGHEDSKAEKKLNIVEHGEKKKVALKKMERKNNEKKIEEI